MTNLAIINEFAIDLEDEIAVQEAMIDAEYNEIMLLESIVDIQEEIYKNKATQKVLTEKGTYDDMAYLFVEAEEQVAEDRKGIFQKFIDLIKKIATNISNAVKALFGIEVNKEEIIELYEDFANPQNRSALSNFANKLGGAKGIAGIAAAAIAAGGLAFLFVKTNKKAKMKVGDAEAAAQQMDKDKNAIASILAKFQSNPESANDLNKAEGEGQHTNGDFIKTALSWISSKVNAVLAKIKSLVPGGNKEGGEGQAQTAPAQNGQSNTPQIKGNEATVTVGGAKFIFGKDGNLINALNKDGKPFNPDANLLQKAKNKFLKLAFKESNQPNKPATGAPATNVNGFQKGRNNAVKQGKLNQMRKTHPERFDANGNFIGKEAELIDLLLDGESEVFETEEGFEITVADEVMEAFVECMNDDEAVAESAEEEISMTESLFGTLAALEAEKDPEFNELKNLIDSL